MEVTIKPTAQSTKGIEAEADPAFKRCQPVGKKWCKQQGNSVEVSNRTTQPPVASSSFRSIKNLITVTCKKRRRRKGTSTYLFVNAAVTGGITQPSDLLAGSRNMKK